MIPWRGSLGTITNYINVMGQSGMPSFASALVNSLFDRFPVFPTVPSPNKQSAANQIGDNCRKDPRNLNKNDIYLYKIDCVTQKLDPDYRTKVLELVKDYTNSTKAYTEFSLYRKILKKTWQNFYDKFL